MSPLVLAFFLAVAGVQATEEVDFIDGTELVAGTEVTVRADANADTKSVRFLIDGVPKRIDSVAPFEHKFTPTFVGNHVLSAEPWSGTNASGTKGPIELVNFIVVPSQTPTPTATTSPPSSPTPTATPQSTPTPSATPSASPTPVSTPMVIIIQPGESVLITVPKS